MWSARTQSIFAPRFPALMNFLLFVTSITWEKLVIAVVTRAVLEYVAKIPTYFAVPSKRVPEILAQSPVSDIGFPAARQESCRVTTDNLRIGPFAYRACGKPAYRPR